MSKFDYVKTHREDVQQIPTKYEGIARAVLKFFTRINVWVFKLSKGQRMKYLRGNRFPICLVTMTGAKTGKKREIALVHLPHGDNKLLVASQGGLSTNPVWYRNIVANPQIDIMVDGTTKTYIARTASDTEKRELWPHLLSLYPDFDEYQARTDRDIPVLICEPT